MTPRQLTRRELVVSAGGAVVLLSCGGKNTSNNDAAPASGKPAFLMPFFATGDGGEPPVLRAGVEQRAPWGLADVDGVPLRDVPADVSFTLTTGGTAVGAPISAARHDDGVPFPYFPLRFTAPTAGVYTATVTVGGAALPRDFVVAAPESVRLVQRGEKAIPVETPTTSDARGVEKVCTREPACAFHDTTLAAALRSGKPTALIISTPAHCQTNVCGPVLESLIEAASARSGINFIHAEVYAKFDSSNPGASTLAEAVTAYGLTYEPSLLIIDAGGVVVERLDFTWDRAELADAFDRLRSG